MYDFSQINGKNIPYNEQKNLSKNTPLPTFIIQTNTKIPQIILIYKKKKHPKFAIALRVSKHPNPYSNTSRRPHAETHKQ